ncbi:hypothetical protein DFP73DRAFT_541853, partial [Morchella snyderi]
MLAQCGLLLLLGSSPGPVNANISLTASSGARHPSQAARRVHTAVRNQRQPGRQKPPQSLHVRMLYSIHTKAGDVRMWSFTNPLSRLVYKPRPLSNYKIEYSTDTRVLCDDAASLASATLDRCGCRPWIYIYIL